MIFSFSSFYYDTKVIAQPYNGSMDVNEGNGEFQVSVPVKDYTLSTLAIAIQNAMNSQGTLNYSVSINRRSRIMTISADASFDLLTSTGSTFGSSIWELIGMVSATDLTGQTSYVGTAAIGRSYTPQFKLQDYISKEDYQERNEASKNVASIGTVVEIINFGIAKFIEFDIKFITNIPMDGRYIKSNPTGVQDARDFLRYVTELNEFEFMEDCNAPEVFDKVIVERMPSFEKGTGYKLNEMLSNGLQDIYETGKIKLRVID